MATWTQIFCSSQPTISLISQHWGPAPKRGTLCCCTQTADQRRRELDPLIKSTTIAIQSEPHQCRSRPIRALCSPNSRASRRHLIQRSARKLFQVQTSRQHPINLIVYISFFFLFLSFIPFIFSNCHFGFVGFFVVVCGSEYFWFSRDLSVL